MKPFFKSVAYITLCAAFAQPVFAQDELNIYSARKEAYIKPLLNQFAAQRNVTINLVTSKADALIQRLVSEGKNTPADVLITVDAGRLYRAKEAGILRAVNDTEISRLVPEPYRDSEGFWYGLSLRVRAIVFHKERVAEQDLSSYEQLSSEQWKNRICIRSSGNIYNQSLMASMIAHHGVEAMNLWTPDFVSNFARKPQGGDRDQIKAVAAGQCDIAVVNSYYLGKMLSGTDDEKSAASQVKIFWPNQDDRGVHVNISGVGITAHAKHSALAKELVKFLLADESQQWYGDVNLEYPIRKDIPKNELLTQWGSFKADSLHLEELGKLNTVAVQVMDRAEWR